MQTFTGCTRALCAMFLGMGWCAGTLAESPATERWVELPLSVSQKTLDRVMAVPEIKLSPGLHARVLVGTGHDLFDPFDLHVVDAHRLWVADDARSGAVYEVTVEGKVTRIADIRKHAPYAIDVAPASFGKSAGKIYAIAFAEPEKRGGWELPNAITRIDPATGQDSVVCYLPKNAAGIPGSGGFFARFGPENSPFAGKLWITAASNHTIYTITADDKCAAFKTLDLDSEGSPRGIGFTPDGKTLLLGVAAPPPANRNKTTPGGGRVLRMSADGTLAAAPLVSGLHEPGALAYAPPGFGKFGGELFVSDAGEWNNDVEATEPISRDGVLYRVSAAGKLETVASGLANPVGVGFMGNALVISDINGDFHVGTQKFADGFMYLIEAD